MQECFRKYPEIYGAELADDEEAEAEAAVAAATASPERSAAAQPKSAIDAAEDKQQPQAKSPISTQVEQSEKKPGAETTPAAAVADSQVAPPWEDATDANNDPKAEETPAEANKADAEGKKKE
jgi:intermembrane space import and assembly protein 40